MNQHSTRRDHSLDGIRGLAAVAVLAFHTWLFSEAHSTMLREHTWDYFFAELSLGLYLFFVLSGYLLFRPLLRRKDGNTAWPGVRTYARKRVVRIVPAYYVSLVAAIVLLYSGSSRLGPHLPPEDTLWTYFLFAQNYFTESVLRLNAATWTLVVEVAFYVVFPVLGLWVARGRERLGPAVSLAVAMIVAGTLWNWWTLGEGAVWRLALPGMLPYFACGLLAAVAVEWAARRKTDGEAGLLQPATGRLLMAAGVALVVLDIVIRELFIDAEFTDVLRAVPAGLGFALIIFAATAGRAGARPLGSRLLVWLGAISYGVFLWQTPLILAARDRGWLPDSVWTAFVPVLLASIAAAVLSRRLVEGPVERWAARRSRAAATIAPS